MLAASMAFSIYAECSERWALPYAWLLWHPPSSGAQRLTPNNAQQMADELKTVEELMIGALRPHLKMSDELFYKHYYAETLHSATSLAKLDTTFIHHFIKSANIPGLFTFRTTSNANGVSITIPPFEGKATPQRPVGTPFSKNTPYICDKDVCKGSFK
jgi:hypothetical protein